MLTTQASSSALTLTKAHITPQISVVVHDLRPILLMKPYFAKWSHLWIPSKSDFLQERSCLACTLCSAFRNTPVLRMVFSTSVSPGVWTLCSLHWTFPVECVQHLQLLQVQLKIRWCPNPLLFKRGFTSYDNRGQVISPAITTGTCLPQTIIIPERKKRFIQYSNKKP